MKSRNNHRRMERKITGQNTKKEKIIVLWEWSENKVILNTIQNVYGGLKPYVLFFFPQ